jgi:DNA-binding MarR family transcriptional regulator
LQLLDQLDSYNEQMDAMLGGLSEEEAKMLNQLLDKVRSSE